MEPVAKGARLSGPERRRLARALRRQYDAGAGIHELAAGSGRSYGSVRTLLLEAGTTLRARGGSKPRRRRTRIDSTDEPR